MIGERRNRARGETSVALLDAGPLDHGGALGAAVDLVHDSKCQERSRRIPYQGMVVLHPEERGERVDGEVWNLSTGGMFIKTILPLRAGTVLNVEIPMQPIKYQGMVKVLWTRLHEEGPDQPYGMAVEWTRMTIPQKRLLFSQIDSHVRSGGDLLVGTPDADRKGRVSAQAPAEPTAAAPDRTKLVVGLAVAVVVVVALVVLI